MTVNFSARAPASGQDRPARGFSHPTARTLLMLLAAPALLGAVVIARAAEQPAAAPPAKAPADKTPTDKAPAQATPESEVVKQAIPAAAYSIELRLIPGSADGAIKPLYISTTEVTWDAFDSFVYRLDEEAGAPAGLDAVTRPSKPYLPPDRGFGHEGFAAISMSHKTATEFCNWLSAHSGHTYRLLTEAEWEHACRAGATTTFSVGDDAAPLHDVAWFMDNSEQSPHPVGTKKANAWGLFDMHGNVAEWCNGADGKPVTRGGSYRDPAPKLACSAREAQTSAWNASDPQIPKSQWWLSDAPFVGFRIAREVQPAKDTK
jgi:hypothetical protein